ncbi:amidase [Roseomonas fluvialis]|uniref:Glutamyl-tRNA amidotransferase subunit A n=1 Tax=Roseomonas fluvialis TaxID=1750527 RepID=A0ABM7Y8Q1_9PROT|nr:amidase family protein [Roseomonas fluvialis]BDG74450.1 glutamyl-tRNA amidotransferase subunit A [Roseomonas fluvialis]
MSDDELLFMSATRAAALIRSRRLSPVEYLAAVLAAIERTQPRLNCFVALDEDRARAAAAAAEQAVMAGAPLGPLHGVPVHVKDLLDVAGLRTTHGSAIHAQAKPAARDDVLVTRLRGAGAIIIGKTTTPEFGVKGLTDGPSFGVTRNPWNLDRTSGGSSGGAAAAVAAGLGPLGLGTDGAGSIRGPAACCGVVGLKPTLGLVPADTARDAFGNNTYAGPLARSVTDAATMHAVLAGPSALDPWSLGAAGAARPMSPMLMGEDLSALRIGYVPRCANPRVAADVAANTRATLDAWAVMGAVVEEVQDPIDWIEYEGRVLYQANFAVFCAPYLPEWRDRMDPVTVAFMERGAQFALADFRNAQFARTRLFRAVQALFDRYDMLVMPTMTRTALPAAFDAANDDVMVDGVACGITRQGWTSPQYPFNLTGHPAISLPSGFGADGLPTAVQVVGRWGAEADVLRVGALLERAMPWAHRTPALT